MPKQSHRLMDVLVLHQKSVPIINKSKKALLFQTFNVNLADNDYKLQLEKQDKIAFLSASSFERGRVTIIHHFK